MTTTIVDPTVDDVAVWLRARTTEISTGDELGTFTTVTRPTAAQVAETIAVASNDVKRRVGVDTLDELADDATQAIALRAAMIVELSYFPEQVRADVSPYRELKALYDEKVEELRLAELHAGTDEKVGGADDLTEGLPSYSFPDWVPWPPGSEQPVGGWSTQW